MEFLQLIIMQYVVLLTFQTASGQQDAESHTALGGQVELARLIDLCAQRLGLQIEYDSASLKGTVTLRLAEELSDQQLWDLTNQLLATRGFASVQPAGQSIVSIVNIGDAPALARLERSIESAAGFVTLVTSTRNRPAKELVEPIKLLLSKPAGSVNAVGERLLLISDLKPRVEDALRLIDLVDEASNLVDQPIIERIDTREIAATQLATMVTAAIAARDAIAGQPLKGKLVATTEGQAVMLIAPTSESPFWRGLIAQLDVRQPVETRYYTPKYFAAGQVAALIEQTLDQSSAGAATPLSRGGRSRIIVDELTGSLIITATPTEHEHIQGMIQRLDSVQPEGRRPVRTYIIQNRRVAEILEVLTRLVEAGVLKMESAQSEEQGIGGAYQQAIRDPLATIQSDSTGKPTAEAQKAERDSKLASSSRSGTDHRRNPDQNSMASQQPAVSLTADEGSNTLIAMGESRVLVQIDQLVQQLDIRQTQVMIEVLVINLTDADTLDLGIELRKLEISGGTFINLSSLFGLGSPGLNVDSPPTTQGSGFTGIVLNPGDFSVLVRALQTINKGRSLSMPKVLVNNNQQATLDSVLQQPFVSTNASDTVATTSFGGTQDAGTTVTVKPQIAQGDHLILDYSVSLSAFVGDAADPRVPPPRQQNNLTSVVSIPDGHTVVVGGLEIVSETNAVSQIPLLGEVPLLGEMFKSRSKSRNRSRFFVFIRCNVLRHPQFEDLKFLGGQNLLDAGLDDGWPVVEPRVIR